MILYQWHGQGVGDTSFACMAGNAAFAGGWNDSRKCEEIF
jgi:hypothetical protein